MTRPEMEAVVAEAEYRVGNPSAWEEYDDRASEIIRTLLSERRKMVEALEPFAKAAGKLDGHWADHEVHWNDPTRSGVTVAHIRAARAALTGSREQ